MAITSILYNECLRRRCLTNKGNVAQVEFYNNRYPPFYLSLTFFLSLLSPPPPPPLSLSPVALPLSVSFSPLFLSTNLLRLTHLLQTIQFFQYNKLLTPRTTTLPEVRPLRMGLIQPKKSVRDAYVDSDRPALHHRRTGH